VRSGLPIDVRQLLDPERVEGVRVEYKATWDEQTGPSALRTICAFANDVRDVNGGYLLIGVEEQGGLPVLPPRGLPPNELDSLQRRIRGEIRGAIKPDYAPTFFVEVVDGAQVLVLQCHPGDDRPYKAHFRQAEPEHYVRINSETQVARGELLRQLLEVSTRRPFDDRPCYEARIDDLDPALIQAHLVAAGSDLANSREDLADRARRLDLLYRVNGHEVPRNVALLFFCERPKRYFHGAAIEVALMPQGRGGDEIISQTIEGPLPTMIRTALQHVRGLLPTLIRKSPDRAEAEHSAAWPFAAIEEALVNAIHHRSYEPRWPDPVQVLVLPDAIEIISYPGPMPGLTLSDLRAGRPRSVSARNRRIAELLKQERLAERLGTGLGKIQRVMRENGSPPAEFDFDEEVRSSFLVRLPIHPSFRLRGSATRPAQKPRVGRPVPPEELVGREALLAKIRGMLEHHSVLVMGPKGRGVSSVLNALGQGERVFHLDLARVNLEGLEAALATWAEGVTGRRVSSPAERDRPDQMNAILSLLGAAPLWLVLDHFETFGRPEDGQTLAWRQESVLELSEKFAHVRLALGVSEPDDVVPEDAERWINYFEPAVVPPLDHDASVELALRLLAGVGKPEDLATAEAVAELSAGIPEIIVRLNAQLGAERVATPEAATIALDALCTRRGDPTHLVGRIRSVGNAPYVGSGYGSVANPQREALLDLVASGSKASPRLELIAEAVSGGHARLDVLSGLEGLLQDGWLVEVDGVVRFEHPWVRDAWVRHRATPPRSSLPYSDEDIPF